MNSNYVGNMNFAVDKLNNWIADLTSLMHQAGMESSMEINEVLTQLEVISIRLSRIIESGE